MSLADDLAPDEPDQPHGHVEVTSTGARIETGPLSEPIGEDWTPILESFGLDSGAFEVVDDTVRMSKWQQSKRLESGERDIVWLYSYRAQFRKRAPDQLLADADLEDAARRVKVRKPRSSAKGHGPEVAYVHLQGDEQSGKSEGGGLVGLLEREREVVANSVAAIKSLRKAGANITSIVDLAAGDRVENIFGHYPSQARTTATLRKQIGFAVDMDLERTEAFAAFGLPLVKAYTPSNHGELRQVIGQSPYTSASDNLDLTIAEYVRRVLDRTPLADQIEWHIPHDEWITTLDICGLPVGLTHGHKVTGKVTEWVRKQRDDLHFHDGKRLVLMFMGHLHHAHIEDCAGTTLIQTPTLDGGSPYFQAASGQRSTHGALGMLVGSGLRAGFDRVTWL